MHLDPCIDRVDIEKQPDGCDHPVDSRVVEVYGGVSHEGGECVDTTETVLVCTKCGQSIVEEVKEEILF